MLTLQDLRRSSRKLDPVRAPRLCGGISGALQLTRGHQDTKANGSRRLNTHKNAFEEVCVRSHVTAPVSKHDLLQQDSSQSPSELYSLVNTLQVH